MPDDPKPNQTTIIGSQIGIIGDNATVYGGIHFYGRPADYYAPFQPPPLPRHFAPRTEVSQLLKARLLAESGDAPDECNE